MENSRKVMQIYKSLTGINRGGLRDWLNGEKLAYQAYMARCINVSRQPKTFIDWLNEKYPAEVKSVEEKQIIEKLKIEGDKPKKEIKKIFGMPSYLTYGVGILALTSIIFVTYRIIKK
jgi:hypothetical protein